MTADQFVTLALGWLGAAVTIGGAGMVAYFKLRAQFLTLRAQSEQNAQRLDIHDKTSNIDSAALCAKPMTSTTNPK